MSFAGEDRDLVSEVVDGLKASGAKLFYDEDQLTETWGEELPEFFDKVYRLRSRYTIIFVSRHYATKMWPRHERRSALARALEQPTPYVLPVRLDDTELDGLRPTVGYLDSRRVGVAGIIKASREKLAGTDSAVTQPNLDRVPRNELERQEVLGQRPAGWEYLLFGAELLRARDAIEEKYRDHRLGYARSSGEHYTDDTALELINRANAEALRLSSLTGSIMTEQAQEAAFGAQGEPGDPALIAHLADRWNSIYEGFLDWSAWLRGCTVPDRFREAVEALSHFADPSIENYRAHVDECVRSMDEIPSLIASEEPMKITLTWTLEIPDEITARFTTALEALED